MVKNFFLIFSLITFGPVISAQSEEKELPCDSEVVAKVKNQGLRSLKGSEILRYFLDLRKCEDQEEARTINKQAEQTQLIRDAEKSKYLQGFTSGFVYFTIAILLYLVLS